MKNVKILSLLIIGLLCILTIGFSAFSADMIVNDMIAYIRPITDVRITRVVLNTGSSSGFTSNNFDYDVSNITGSFQLNNIGSRITYEVDVTVYGSSEMAIKGISVGENGSGLTASISGYSLKTKICDNSNSSKCSLNATKTVYVTVERTSGSTVNYNNVRLDFDFKEIYDISYVDMNNTGYPTNILNGDNMTITFSDNSTYNGAATYVYNTNTLTVNSYTSTIPSGVAVTGNSNNSYTNGVLTISNVSGDITLTASYAAANVVEDNTTQTYDPDNVPTNTTIVYKAIAGEPQVSTDSSGNITSFEYTGASSSNPVEITSSTPVSTGFVPFAADTNWELNMTFRYSSEDNGSTSAAQTVGVLGCISWVGSQINSGFTFRFYNFKNSGTGSNTYKYNNMLKYRSSIWKENPDGTTTQVVYGLFNTNSSGMIATSPMTYSVHITKVGSNITFTLTNLEELIYNPTKNENSAAKGLTTAPANTPQTISWTDTGISNTVDITIGGYLSSSGAIDKKTNIDVYSFAVHKTN